MWLRAFWLEMAEQSCWRGSGQCLRRWPAACHAAGGDRANEFDRCERTAPRHAKRSKPI